MLFFEYEIYTHALQYNEVGHVLQRNYYVSVSHANYSAQNGSESRFRDKCFFLVLTCVTYYGLFYCTHLINATLVEINCTIGVVLRPVFLNTI